MSNGQSKHKKQMSQRILKALDLPPESLPHQSVIELHGDRLLKIEGGGAILLYTECEIRIALKFGGKTLCVHGRGLSCSSYNMGNLGIEGEIGELSFLSEGMKNEKERKI